MFAKKTIKIFCIGRNKTGTSSLELALKDLGYKMGNQAKAEILIKDYAKSNWKPIIDFCKTADAFQDVPFSSPYTWLILHEHYPESKFILTTRDAEKWYQSITSFHTKLFSKNSNPPTSEDLKNATYRYKGYIWDENRAVWNTPENELYNKKLLIDQYELHNKVVRNFFRNKSNFLDIDISEADSYNKLCGFLNKKPLYSEFPHINKTSDIK